MKSLPSITRRRFLRRAAGAAPALFVAPTLIPASVLGAGAPSGRIAMGCIGTGEQGTGVMGNFLAQRDARVVAVCDVNAPHAAQAKAKVDAKYQNQDCQVYRDFRELAARTDIDAVLIATPDHWHVLTAIAALQSGKDVYLEKPLAVSLREGQALRATVRRHNRIFQFGTQQRSSNQFRQACEIVRNGRLGPLRQINVWAPGSNPGGSTEVVPAPAGLDYEFWLGPAARTPHTRDKCAFEFGRKTWWFNYDYTLGWLSGWGIHPLDIALWGAGARLLNGRVEVRGSAVLPTRGACNTATTWDVDFDYDCGVKMKFLGRGDGLDKTPAAAVMQAWAARYGRDAGHGTAFEGRDGWVLVDRGGIRAQPEKLLEESPDSYAVQLPRSSSHARNFLDSVKSRQPAICPVAEAFQADVLCHLSNTATRLHRPVTWDLAREEFVDDGEATRFADRRKIRAPWTL